MKKGKKILRRVLLFFAAALLVFAVILLELILPVTYDLPEELLRERVGGNVTLTEVGPYRALKKTETSDAAETFRVLGFTDTHLDHKEEKGEVTMEYLIKNIVTEKPDLVVFVGDNITSALNRPRARQLAKTMESLGVYWTLVLGNHEGDNFFSMSRASMLRLFSRYPHCLVEASPKRTSDGTKVDGNGNHCLLLLDADGEIAEALIFIDGGAEMSEADLNKYADEYEDQDHHDYDYVKESQILWYRETVEKLETLSSRQVPSVVFDHIALPEYQAALDGGESPVFGEKRETICYSGHNSGLFDAMKESGSTQAFICGHDHINDFGVMYEGILLAYNCPSGYSSYNTYTKGISEDLLQGCSLYTFGEDGSFTMTQLYNCDRWPEAQEEIRAMYD